MSFRIPNDEAVEPAVQRIADGQLGKAIRETDDAGLDAPERVHQVRKRLKKLRARLRLVRPALGQRYRDENAWFRDTARRLSDVRDARANFETFDRLFARHVDEAAFDPVRQRLPAQMPVAGDESLIESQLGELQARLDAARDRVDAWRFEADGFDAIAGGLRPESYRTGSAKTTISRYCATRCSPHQSSSGAIRRCSWSSA